MSAETPTSTEEKKPETLFIRCSVVVIGIFLAVIILNFIFSVAFVLDRQWGLLGGAIISERVFSVTPYWHGFLFPVFGGILLQLAWWVFLIFCYICGKYDQVAERYYGLEWFEIFGPVPSMFRFPIFPLQCGFLGLMFLLPFFYLAVGGVWIWHLIF